MLPLDRQIFYRELYRQANPGWRPATEVFSALVRSRLKPDSRVLDLGCGRGGLVEQLDHPLNQIVGVDPDLQSLLDHRLARQKTPFYRVAALSQKLPFADNSFDLIYATWVLEHLVRPEDDLAEIARILRPGGLFIFVTPNKSHPLIAFNRLMARAAGLQRRFIERLYGRAATDTFPAHYQANSAVDLRRLASTTELQLAQLQTVADPTYLAFSPAFYRASCWLESRLPPIRHIHLVGSME